ncbi:signal peptide, CUB and EGF-like domain-containing protein 2 [Caerostris darwini]|uniref:Signal peptide, CUB and EGF-like domain-containing protein 2 n=1 Tax=Caerostris darwini TaxID=1538125 RepID=A0AAV4RQA1_9ARAC|nr:signal peptide, CUB and EGF-like domain-containing protein 2 [Caerostris darwini]
MINPSDKIDLNTRRILPANTRPVLPSVERHLNQFTKEKNMIGIVIFAAFLQAVAHVHSEGGTCSDSKGWDTENTIYKNLEYREKKFVFIQCKYEGFRVDGDHTIECVHGQPAKPLPQCKLMRQKCISLKDPPNGSKLCSPLLRKWDLGVLSGAPVRITCKAPTGGTGQDHRWTGQEAQCLLNSTALNTGCPHLSAPFFGWKSCNPNDKDLGSVCTFECNSTHYLKGSKVRRCTQDHKWSGAPTRCILKPECSLRLRRRLPVDWARPTQMPAERFACGQQRKRVYPSCHRVTDPCTTSNCQQFCRPVYGRAQCYCYKGFALTENGRTCSDIDECKTNTDTTASKSVEIQLAVTPVGAGKDSR